MVVQASLSAFEAEFVQSADMQDYVVSLQRATTTLENSMPLPPLGEHVTYLQNALVSPLSPCMYASLGWFPL